MSLEEGILETIREGYSYLIRGLPTILVLTTGPKTIKRIKPGV